MKKRRGIFFTITLSIILITVIFQYDRLNEKEDVIHESLLNFDKVEYIRVTGPLGGERIQDDQKVESIISLLQELNGEVELEQLPTGPAIISFSIALEGHYPSGPILIYKNRIYHGKGRNVSPERVNELLEFVKNNNTK